MYKYEFVRIKLKSGFTKYKPTHDYQEIVREYAEEGWRLVQIFAPAINGYGAANFYELIFEKEMYE